MSQCCDHDHGEGGHSHGGPPQGKPVAMTPEQQAMMKKIETARKELIKIANFISSKGLKTKVAMFNEN